MFVYNRPAHTKRTLDALSRNALAGESDLTVYSDFARADKDREAVAAVRDVVDGAGGFKSVTVVKRERNYGLADSIVDGVTACVSAHGTCIVLEDDIETSPQFLSYMNAALERYRENEQVMHVAGYMLPILQWGLPEAFFLRQSSCWGWATWERAWKHFSRDAERYVSEFSPEAISRFNLDGAYDYWAQLEANARGELRTWAVFWYASVFQRGGLCLHPRQSLVFNTGFDGSGVNCGAVDVTQTVLSNWLPREFPTGFVENPRAMKRYQRFLRRGPSGPVENVLGWLKGE
jgi:hypothetical protein